MPLDLMPAVIEFRTHPGAERTYVSMALMLRKVTSAICWLVTTWAIMATISL